MSKFRRLTSTLILVLYVVIHTVQGIGRLQPAPIAILFTNPDGTPCQQPCLFGVRPRETTYKQAIALLHAHPFTRNFRPNATGNVLSDGQTSIIVGHFVANPGVSEIVLLSHSPSSPIADWASLGQVIGFLGAPDSVAVTSTFTTSFYSADRLVFVHRHRMDTPLDVQEPFEFLAVYAYPPGPEVAGSAQTPLRIHWTGFRNPARAYGTHRPNK